MSLKTEIIVITDRSGSMSSIANEVIGGYNNFIEAQKKEPGECRVTFTQFDDQYEVVYQGKDLKDVPVLDANTFQPRGMTALNDAIGRTLEVQGKRIAEEKWAELVIVQIITDGGENASSDYTSARVKEMTEHAQKNGWKFLFLAANQDAFATAQNYGFAASGVTNIAASAMGASASYAATSVAAASLRSLGVMDQTLEATYDSLIDINSKGQ